MATAYAALFSLTHIIERMMEHHVHQPIFLHKQQRLIESLQQKVSFLQDFLEVYSHGGSNEAQGLASRITDAAYAAQDIIEYHVQDTILRQPKKNIMVDAMQSCFSFNEKNTFIDFSRGLQKVMDKMDCIMKEVMENNEKSSVKDQNPLMPIVSSRPPSTGKDTMMEYYNDDLELIMDKLTGQSSNLQIIPIVGMSGIGKTTLARNILEDALIVEYFYVRGWVTVSQEYNLPKMLLGLLREIEVPNIKEEQESGEYHQLGEILYKYLSGRKYLIILDDIWSIEVFEKLKFYLPNNKNGSRVMVTSRLSNIVDSFGSSHIYKMSLLDENKSWSLLCRKVFGVDGHCPQKLVQIGKDIAKNCKGLPLSIVVIAGLLAKSKMTRKYWEYVAKDINQIVNTENNGHWLEVLYLSYSHLPIHLKPCFLYMGVYPEDHEIRISDLIKLWVAEGFLKPNKAKSLEEVAEDCLKDLVERNLILIRKWGSVGKMKTCSIHDLLRDLCLKEAKKERFRCVVNPHNHAQYVKNERRIVFQENWSHVSDSHLFDHAVQSTPSIHPLPCSLKQWSSSRQSRDNLRLLRVLNAHILKSNVLEVDNLRYLKCDILWGYREVLSSTRRLWYLQTLILTGYEEVIIAPNEIWEMPQLRHIIVKIGIRLPDPLGGQMNGQDDFVLKNLQTLLLVRRLKYTEEVLKRIPNLKKLAIELHQITNMETSSYCLHNLDRLQKLQSLTCYSNRIDLFKNIAFPQSLNKLALWDCHFEWDDITTKVGSLPHLKKLKLIRCRSGAEWNTVEGKFPYLQFFELSDFNDLECWTTDGSHFPLLERLVLKEMTKLKEIPSGIGDTLQSILLVRCGSSVISSAKEILEEQESLGNDSLRLTMKGDVNEDFE